MIKDFSYRLRSSTGNYYQVIGDSLVAGNDITELEHAPDGWQQKSINWKRNWDSFGVIRGFTVPLRFVLDGAEILKYLFYEKGYEADCVLEILQVNDNREYDLIFSGEIDFTTFEQINDFVTVNSIEGGAQKLVNAAKDTIFEIPVNNEEAVNIRMDGINLFSKVKYSIDTLSFGESADGLVLSPFVYLNSEGENIFLFPSDYLSLTNVSDGYHTTSDNWMFKTESELSIRFSGDLNVINRTVPPSTTVSLRIRCSSGEIFNIITYTASGFVQRLKYDVTHTIPSGVKCFLEIVSNNSFEYWSKGSYMNLEWLNRKPETYCKAVTPITLFNELCKKIGVTGHSDLLQNIPIGITSLDGILNINNSGIIKTKLSDFLKFCFTRFSSTWFIDEQDRLRIESIHTAFNNTEIISIDKVRDFKMNVLREPLFKHISAGYETQTVEEVNGKYGFNAKQQWAADVKRVTNTIDMVCPYIADPYAIELNRVKLEGKTTTDNKNDNNVFLLAYDDSFVVTATDSEGDSFDAYTLKRYAGMTGVIDDSVFNFDLSPKHGLINNARLLKSILWQTNVLKLQSGEKNIEASGAGFVEKSDINLSGYSAYFYPVVFTFEPLVEDLIYPVLKSNPRGKVKFNLYGHWFYGFISDISIQPKTGETQNWTLISAPENNIMLLSELAGKCDAPSFDENIPPATKDVSYLYEINLNGTYPIVLSNFTTTNGLNIEIMGNKLRISGTPLVAGLITLAFTLTNCAGSKDYEILLPINSVAAPSDISIYANYSASGDEIELNVGWVSGAFDSEVYVYKNGVLEPGFPQVYPSGSSFFVHSADFSSTYKIRIRNKSGFEYSTFIETDYTTPQECNSYTITNGRRVSYIEYVDCSGVTQNITVAANATQTFCARSVTPTGASIVKNGPC